jgi:Domain of unknown function (DUF4388)
VTFLYLTIAVLCLALAFVWRWRARHKQDVSQGQDQWILMMFPEDRSHALGKDVAAFLRRMRFDMRFLGDTGLDAGTALRKLRPSLVIAHQPTFGDEISVLEQDSSIVASTPILYLDAYVIKGGSRLRSSLPPTAKASQIASTAIDLLNSRPGSKELSRREIVELEIEPGNVLEFLHFLHTMEKTGKIEIRTHQITGTAWMQNGRIVHAAVGRLEGLDALHSILDFVQGTITFAPGVAPIHRTIKDGAMSVLAEYARQRDELAKASRN